MKLSYQITGTLLSNSLRRALISNALAGVVFDPDFASKTKQSELSRLSSTRSRRQNSGISAFKTQDRTK